MNVSSLKDFLWLRTLLSIEGIGPSKIVGIISKFEDSDRLLSADIYSLCSINGISRRLAAKILGNLKNYTEAHVSFEREKLEVDRLGGRIITYFDPDYPKSLRNIYFPPMILYIMGELTENDKNSIAIVGTRTPSHYGKYQTEKLTRELVNHNITIISGLARGIDTAAHSNALRNGGRTIAVTGSGLDVVYPPENARLYAQIRENGAIITEYPPGTKPDAQNFPRRNRIISGLSLGTVIIETRKSGGALLTAEYALDQNKEVFAIPGNIDSKMSEGTNLLIQKGEAKLITNAEDVLLELELKLKPEIGKNIPKPALDLNFFEEKILNSLELKTKQIDQISEETNIPTGDCLVYLLSLEFKGLVRQYPGKVFSRTDTNIS